MKSNEETGEELDEIKFFKEKDKIVNQSENIKME